MKNIYISACPHLLNNGLESWTIFTKHLCSKLNFTGEFKPYCSFIAFKQHFAGLDLIYANSVDAIYLRDELKFFPLAKYSEKYDEAVIIVNKSSLFHRLSQINGKKGSCIVGNPSHLAVSLDFNKYKKEVHFEVIKRESYLEVLSDIRSLSADFGIVLKETWNELKDAYSEMEVLYTTYTHNLSHIFMLSPRLAKDKEKIEDILLSLNIDSEGQEILKILGCHKLERFNDKDLTQLNETLNPCNIQLSQ